jgi:hypothetical protein
MKLSRRIFRGPLSLSAGVGDRAGGGAMGSSRIFPFLLASRTEDCADHLFAWRRVLLGYRPPRGPGTRWSFFRRIFRGPLSLSAGVSDRAGGGAMGSSRIFPFLLASRTEDCADHLFAWRRGLIAWQFRPLLEALRPLRPRRHCPLRPRHRRSVHSARSSRCRLLLRPRVPRSGIRSGHIWGRGFGWRIRRSRSCVSSRSW